MNSRSEHCDLCGARLESSRANGWAGTLVIKGVGNYRTDEAEEERNVCPVCADAIRKTIDSLKRSFKVKHIIEYEKGEQQ